MVATESQAPEHPDDVDTSSLPPDSLLDRYRRMVTIRRFEETVYDVHNRGTMPGLAHLYTGEEAVAVAVDVCVTPMSACSSWGRPSAWPAASSR